MESNLKKSINSSKSNDNTVKLKNSQIIINNEEKGNIKTDEITTTTKITTKENKKKQPLNKNTITLSEQNWVYKMPNQPIMITDEHGNESLSYEIPFDLLLKTKKTQHIFVTDKDGFQTVKTGTTETTKDSEPFKFSISKNKNDENWKLIIYKNDKHFKVVEKCNIINELSSKYDYLYGKDKHFANKDRQQQLNELLRDIDFEKISTEELHGIIKKVVNNLVEPILKDYADKMNKEQTKLQNNENACKIKNKIITKFKKINEESRKSKALHRTYVDLLQINNNISNIQKQQQLFCSDINDNFARINESIAFIEENYASINSIMKKKLIQNNNDKEGEEKLNNNDKEDEEELNRLKNELKVIKELINEKKQPLIKLKLAEERINEKRQLLIKNIDELQKLSKQCKDIIEDKKTENAIKDTDDQLLTIYGNIKKTLIPKLTKLQKELEYNISQDESKKEELEKKISQYESKKKELEKKINRHGCKKKRIIPEVVYEKKISSKESNKSKEKKSYNNTHVGNDNDKNNFSQLDSNNGYAKGLNISKSNNIDDNAYETENINNDKNILDVTINNNNVKKIDYIEDSKDNSLKDNGPDTNAIRRMKYLNLNLNINNQNTLTKINTNTKEHTININKKINKNIKTNNGPMELTVIQKDNNDPGDIDNNDPEKKGNDGLKNKDNNGVDTGMNGTVFMNGEKDIKAGPGNINGIKISNNIIDDKDNNLNIIITKKDGNNININDNIENSLLNKENPNIFLNNININNNEQLNINNNDDKKINTINTNIIQNNNNTNSGVLIGGEKDINANLDGTIINKENTNKPTNIVEDININNNDINTESIVNNNNGNTKKKSNNNILNARNDNNLNKNNNPRQKQLKWYQCRCCFPDLEEINPNEVNLMNNNQANMHIFGEGEKRKVN